METVFSFHRTVEYNLEPEGMMLWHKLLLSTSSTWRPWRQMTPQNSYYCPYPSFSLSPFKRPFSRCIWVSQYQNDYIGAKDVGGGGDNWTCKAPVTSSPPTNQHPVFLRARCPCGLRGCKNWPAPFPGQMSYKATKPGLVSVLYLSMFFIVLVFIRALYMYC